VPASCTVESTTFLNFVLCQKLQLPLPACLALIYAQISRDKFNFNQTVVY